MMKTTILHGLSIAGLALLAACQSPSKPAQTAKSSTKTKGAVDAAKVFDAHCMACHGSDGKSKTFPGFFTGATNLTKPAWQQKTTNEQMTSVISKGHRMMPAFENKLSKVEIKALVVYVRHLKSDS